MNHNKTLQLGVNVSQVHWALQNYINRRLKSRNISLDKLRILNIIDSNEGCSQQLIADLLFKTKTAIANMVDLLVKNNLVTRVQDSENRRLNKINLTSEGKKLHDQCMEEIIIYTEEVCQGIDAEEISQAIDLLKKVRDNIV